MSRVKQSGPPSRVRAAGAVGDGSLPTTKERPHARISRRQLLNRGGQGLLGATALAVAGGRGAGHLLASGARVSTSRAGAERAGNVGPLPAGRFRTAPDLVPPDLQIAHLGAATDSGSVMVTPSLLPGVRGLDQAGAVATGKGQMGLMILDVTGEIVWFQPSAQLTTNLQVQQYRGRPVLTYWQGKIVNGIGYGEGHLLDASYRSVATIKAVKGLQVDLHELTITPQNTALVTAYREQPADLSAIGGPAKSSVFEGVIQEIDIETGKLLFEWQSLDHVGVDESYIKATKGPADYFHINSIALWDDESLLVSARSTWAAYRINRKTGEVIWRLGGKKSDFAIEQGAHFEWQHHIRRVAASKITVFDDAATPAEEHQSRALILNVDETRRRVTLDRAYTHPANLLTYYEGSVQLLSDGHVFVGWGTEPYSSEFDPAGNLIFDARFPSNDQSYRAFRYNWSGRPATSPILVVDHDDIGGYSAHVSWNGATEVAHWEVWSGKSDHDLSRIAAVPKTGFETAITVHPVGPYLAAVALDGKGGRLASSPIVKV